MGLHELLLIVPFSARAVRLAGENRAIANNRNRAPVRLPSSSFGFLAVHTRHAQRATRNLRDPVGYAVESEVFG